MGAISPSVVAAGLESVSAPKEKAKASKASSGKKALSSGPKKRAAHGSASDDERMSALEAAVKAAGKIGISASKLSNSTNIPYSAVGGIVADSGKFVQKGEKRASRVFLK